MPEAKASNKPPQGHDGDTDRQPDSLSESDSYEYTYTSQPPAQELDSKSTQQEVSKAAEQSSGQERLELPSTSEDGKMTTQADGESHRGRQCHNADNEKAKSRSRSIKRKPGNNRLALRANDRVTTATVSSSRASSGAGRQTERDRDRGHREGDKRKEAKHSTRSGSRSRPHRSHHPGRERGRTRSWSPLRRAKPAQPAQPSDKAKEDNEWTQCEFCGKWCVAEHALQQHQASNLRCKYLRKQVDKQHQQCLGCGAWINNSEWAKVQHDKICKRTWAAKGKAQASAKAVTSPPPAKNDPPSSHGGNVASASTPPTSEAGKPGTVASQATVDKPGSVADTGNRPPAGDAGLLSTGAGNVGSDPTALSSFFFALGRLIEKR